MASTRPHRALDDVSDMARRQRDRALVQEIRAGRLAAWHQFVDQYGDLILSVLRRHLGRDPDETRTLFANVLERLYRTGFAPYEGRAALSTWLVLVTRAMAIDHLRRVGGRPLIPEGVAKLSALDRWIFRLHYREKQGTQEILGRLRAKGHDFTAEMLIEAITRIESVLDRHTLRRLAYEAQASSIGVISGRLLEFLEAARDEADRLRFERTPHQELLDREARERIARIELLVDRLPSQEREIVHRHLFRGQTAKEVAQELGLSGPRRVSTVFERAVRRLRRWISTNEAAS
jgi:RNA polymerase sigma factor (sigma-70 family)